MIERTILNINDKVYSFLKPRIDAMQKTPLSVVEDGYRQCIITPKISFKFACAIVEDIKNHNGRKNSICGHILTGRNYEIVVTAVDFMQSDLYPMKITAIYVGEGSA